MKIKIPLCTTVFNFSSKTSFFAGLGALLGTFLVIFFNYKAKIHKTKQKEASTTKMLREKKEKREEKE